MFQSDVVASVAGDSTSVIFGISNIWWVHGVLVLRVAVAAWRPDSRTVY